MVLAGHARSGILALCTAILLPAACSRSSANSTEDVVESGVISSDWEPSEFSSVFEGIRSLKLSETDSSLVVDPTIRPDPSGGFLIADRRAIRVRRYDTTGALLWQFGSGGRKPGQFSAPNVALRIGGDSILVVDSHERATLWSESGDSVVAILEYPLPSVDDVDPLDGHRVLYTARVSPVPGQGADHVLNVVDLATGAVVDHFFQPRPRGIDRFTLQAGWGDSSVHGDTVATVYSLSDSVFFFTTSGARVGSLRLTTNYLHTVHGTRPEDVGYTTWLQRFSYVSSVHWLRSGALIVQYETFENRMPSWSTLGMRRDGSFMFDIPDSPRLYLVDDQERFYFEHPDSSAPGTILVARMLER